MPNSNAIAASPSGRAAGTLRLILRRGQSRNRTIRGKGLSRWGKARRCGGIQRGSSAIPAMEKSDRRRDWDVVDQAGLPEANCGEETGGCRQFRGDRSQIVGVPDLEIF